MNNNDLISDVVFNELKRRREERAKKLEYVEYVRSSDARLKELNLNLNKLNRLIAQATIKGENCQNFLTEKEKLLKEKQDYEKTLFANYNFNFYCEKCQDTGFENQNLCTCFKKLYKNVLFEKLGITPILSANFSMDTLSNKTQLKNIYQKFKTQDLKDFNSCVFFGKCGTGKTFLASCIASNFERQGDVLFLTAFDLNNVFIKYHCAPIEEKPFYFSTLTNCELLVIDDLGSEPIYNKITLEYLFLLLQARKTAKKPFIITTNLSLKEILSRYGERVFSRMIQEDNTEVYEFNCENLRNLQ